jgi:hypothetical protein
MAGGAATCAGVLGGATGGTGALAGGATWELAVRDTTGGGDGAWGLTVRDTAGGDDGAT